MKIPQITLFLALLLLCCCAFTCNETTDQKARDSIATGNGLLAAAQAEYLDTCKANPAQGVCVLINHGVDALNIAITGLETYCSFQLSPVPPAADAKCSPVPTAQAGLNVAVANLGQIIAQLQPLVNSSAVAKKKTALLKRFDNYHALADARFSDIESLRLNGGF